MEPKYSIAAITNGYISQLHFYISKILEQNPTDIHKEHEEMFKLTENFLEKVKCESKKTK